MAALQITYVDLSKISLLLGMGPKMAKLAQRINPLTPDEKKAYEGFLSTRKPRA